MASPANGKPAPNGAGPERRPSIRLAGAPQVAQAAGKPKSHFVEPAQAMASCKWDLQRALIVAMPHVVHHLRFAALQDDDLFVRVGDSDRLGAGDALRSFIEAIDRKELELPVQRCREICSWKSSRVLAAAIRFLLQLSERPLIPGDIASGLLKASAAVSAAESVADKAQVISSVLEHLATWRYDILAQLCALWRDCRVDKKLLAKELGPVLLLAHGASLVPANPKAAKSVVAENKAMDEVAAEDVTWQLITLCDVVFADSAAVLDIDAVEKRVLIDDPNATNPNAKTRVHAMLRRLSNTEASPSSSPIIGAHGSTKRFSFTNKSGSPRSVVVKSLTPEELAKRKQELNEFYAWKDPAKVGTVEELFAKHSFAEIAVSVREKYGGLLPKNWRDAFSDVGVATVRLSIAPNSAEARAMMRAAAEAEREEAFAAPPPPPPFSSSSPPLPPPSASSNGKRPSTKPVPPPQPPGLSPLKPGDGQQRAVQIDSPKVAVTERKTDATLTRKMTALSGLLTRQATDTDINDDDADAKPVELQDLDNLNLNGVSSSSEEEEEEEEKHRDSPPPPPRRSVAILKPPPAPASRDAPKSTPPAPTPPAPAPPPQAAPLAPPGPTSGAPPPIPSSRARAPTLERPSAPVLRPPEQPPPVWALQNQAMTLSGPRIVGVWRLCDGMPPFSCCFWYNDGTGEAVWEHPSQLQARAQAEIRRASGHGLPPPRTAAASLASAFAPRGPQQTHANLATTRNDGSQRVAVMGVPQQQAIPLQQPPVQRIVAVNGGGMPQHYTMPMQQAPAPQQPLWQAAAMAPPVQQWPQPQTTMLAVCAYPFMPSGANKEELPMTPGEQFVVLHQGADGWLTVRRVSDGVQGLVPINFVSVSVR